jgi:hypothetical protein
VTTSPAPTEQPTTSDLAAVRQLVDGLRDHLTTALADLDAQVDALRQAARPEPSSPRRPAPVAPRRMEQMTRTPEPTADLDDLVDVLVPRLVEHLVPALRDALRDQR